MDNAITISRVENREAPGIIAYVQDIRKTLFPMLDHRQLPEDLLEFEKIYMNAKTGAFLKACNGEGRLAGVIGMRAYDYRFPDLNLPKGVVVEVTRLFVEPRLRRTGLATNLFRTLAFHARRQGVQVCYLHTHPFLPGARAFWFKQGFAEIAVQEEPGFTTIHMQCMLTDIPGIASDESFCLNHEIYDKI